jgi:hypothetical protein
MAEYKGIKGFKVQYLDQDPVPTVAGWSAGANLPTSTRAGGSVGTTAQFFQYGGQNPAHSPTVDNHLLSYNGTSWSSLTPLSNFRWQFGSFGDVSEAIAATGEIGGTGTNTSEEYNGSTWGSGGTVATPRTQTSGFGLVPAGVIAGGYTGSPSTAVEDYNGTSWTSGGSLPSGRYASGSAGTQTAGVIFGGIPVSTNAIDFYDGSVWTAQGGSLNTVRAYIPSSTAGTQTAAMVFGGQDGSVYVGSVELWDGTSMTSGSSLSTARGYAHSTRTSTPSGAYVTAGDTGSITNATEEYVDYSPYAGQTVENVGQVWYNGTTKELKFTDETFSSAWATGNNMNTARYD